VNLGFLLLLHGVAPTSCDWLAFGNQVGPLAATTGPT
jgi:hypothetical protein